MIYLFVEITFSFFWYILELQIVSCLQICNKVTQFYQKIHKTRFNNLKSSQGSLYD